MSFQALDNKEKNFLELCDDKSNSLKLLTIKGGVKITRGGLNFPYFLFSFYSSF